MAGIATTAVAPFVGTGEAAAVSRAHRRSCQHWHRCKKHRDHTCRHLHRCKHRHHTAPTSQPQPAPPATPAPTAPPTGGSTPTPPAPTTPPPSTDFLNAPIPTAASLHLATRFTYAMTPALHAQMRDHGSPEAWFEAQLSPAGVADPQGDATGTWWPSLDLDHTAIAQRDRDGVEPGWVAMANYARWCLVRRIYSQRQVLETVTEFWENHLHVPVYDDGVYPYRAAYGKVIRSHALGRFDDMLVAAITHPAMGLSLDNASSTKRAPNENLGRELLELHTVGRGNHTETDVKDSARILTGYRVDAWRTWNASYDTASHWTGAVTVLGFTHPNTSADGRPVAEAYLRYLARHPRTAERIARKLAVRFVSDTPSDRLVQHLAAVFLAHDTEIKPLLRALVADPEFQAAAGLKARTPTDDVIATHRVLRTAIARPVSDDSTANSILWQCTAIGQGPFEWPRPDGQPDDNRSWSSASRVLASFATHYDMAGRWWPVHDVTYLSPTDWLPAPSVPFDALVEHLSRQVLGRPATPRLVAACAQVTATSATATITATHAVMRWKFPSLMTTLLDSPEHMHR